MILANPESVDNLRVAAVEALGKAQESREHAHDAAALTVEG